MKNHEHELDNPSYWQLVFLQSKVNGAPYQGEQLPRRKWDWPKNTYFQRRLMSCTMEPLKASVMLAHHDNQTV